jgi:hypothetical protein
MFTLPPLNCKNIYFAATLLDYTVNLFELNYKAGKSRRIRMNSLIHIVLIQTLFFSGLSVAAVQQIDKVTSVETDYGVLLAWNQPDIHFTIEVKGKDVNASNSTVHANVYADAFIIRVQVIAISEFIENADRQKLSDQAILESLRDWMAQDIEHKSGEKPKVESASQKLSNGGSALMSQYSLIDKVKYTETFLTFVRGDKVLTMIGSGPPERPQSDVRKFLIDTVAIMKFSDEPIDVKKPSESIKKSNPGE